MVTIVPLGEECYTCGSIDHKISQCNSFRNCAFPFDYVAGTSVEIIYNNLYNLMINNEDKLNKTDFFAKYFSMYAPEKKYYLVHKKYNFVYWHDIGSENEDFNKNENIQEFVDKYNRRYTRLKNVIKNSNSIIFYSVNHFNNIFNNIYKKNEILKLYNFLFEINNNIKFIAINFCDKNEKYGNLEFVTLDVNRDLEIIESKLDFTSKLKSFASNYFASV